MDGSSHPTFAPAAESGPPVALLRDLLEALRREGIACCYWKSGRRLQAAMAGLSDLDLLVARDHQHRIQQALLDCGFKHFPSVAGRADPSMISYLGHDEASGRILHVHVHMRVVIGSALLKEYRPPWAALLLEHAIAHPSLPVHVLDPASEAVLCAVRSCLELRRIDPVLLRNWAATEQKYRLDLEHARNLADPATLRMRAAALFSRPVADLLANSILDGKLPHENGALRRALRREMAPWRICNRLESVTQTGLRAVKLAFGRLNASWLHQPRPSHRYAPGGGFVVAVLGVDGSGKSTVVAATRAWLSSEIDVMPIYLGTGGGRPSLLLLPFKLLASLILPMFRVKPKGASHGSTSHRPAGAVYGTLLMIWAAILSVEKQMKLVAARRGADRGLVVLADRYPQNQDAEYNDGPLLHRVPWAPCWLHEFEGRAYALADRLPPDLVIKLDVTADTAYRREPEMAPGLIQERIRAARRLQFPASRVVRVDAEQPLEHVLRAVRREIWAML